MQSFTIRYLPYIIAGLAITVIMVGAYVSVGPIQSAAPKAGWGTDPVTIMFAATAGQGSAIDSFTCDPSTTNVTLVAHASTANIALTIAPSSFASCNSTPDTVTLTATCLVPAAQCVGTYQGLVQIRNPANYYGNIPANLKVTIVVT